MFFIKKKPVDAIVVGLGNPGQQYEKTRHNAGFEFMDYLSGRINSDIRSLKHMAKTGKGQINGRNILLMKPQTYMNKSGESIFQAMRFYKLTPAEVIVIFDDCSLPAGKIRVRRDGRDGGHNGIKSIIEHLHTNEFRRIKIGVGQKPEGYDMSDWVLSKLTVSQAKVIKDNHEKILNALEYMIDGDIEKAMQLYN